MSRPFATVGVDIDPVDLHLHGYSYRSRPPDPLVYSHAVPRLLDLFGRCGVQATLFVVARDATAHADTLAEVVDAGHEIASHSLTHPMGLASMSPEALRREFSESRWLLEQTTGAPVVGFRSPQFDMGPRALELLAEAGYAYDASSCPTPMLVSTRIAMLMNPRSSLAALRLKWLPFSWKRSPHRLSTGPRSMHEFPLSVTPIDRTPLHHALRYRITDARFDRLLAGFARRGEPISYLLHAVDVLGLEEDRVDRRLDGYSGMSRPLAGKLALLERTLSAIAARFETRPFRDRLVVD
jgi:polysaccharide deacetylase